MSTCLRYWRHSEVISGFEGLSDKNVTPPSLAVKCKYLYFLITIYPYRRYVNGSFCKKLPPFNYFPE